LRRFSGPIKHKEAGEHSKNPSPNTIPLQPKSLEANQNQQEDAIHKEDN
jgi:hypothetical protein